MIWGYVVTTGIAVMLVLLAAVRVDPHAPSPIGRVILFGGAVGSALLGLLWIGLSLLLGPCENNNCVSANTVEAIVPITILLSGSTFGIGAALLFRAVVRSPSPSGLTARKFIIAGVVGFALWLMALGAVANAG